MTTAPATVVLDAEGLSAWLRNDRQVIAMLKSMTEAGAAVAVSANTITEVTYARADRPRLDWLLSQIQVEAVTKETALRAAALLTGVGLHGHRHALDASVAEVALRLPAPAMVITSDVDDMHRLCGGRVMLLRV